MKNEIIVSGFGGQGIIVAGLLIAQSAVEQGLNTTWFPSYGAEMRGGTSNATVIVSDDEIGSPISFHPDALIALNEQSLNKFVPRLNKGAVIITSCKKDLANDFNYHFIEMSKIAENEIGNIKTLNMVAVGALIAACEEISKGLPYISKESVLKACEKTFEQKPDFIEINKKAVLAGYNFIRRGK
jgi:2-oxoglutarate ferredoxin oxidoreductase subunit gamma